MNNKRLRSMRRFQHDDLDIIDGISSVRVPYPVTPALKMMPHINRYLNYLQQFSISS